VDRSERRAGHGHRRFADGARDPEIGHLHVAVVGDEDVSRLHVAVDDPLAVRDLERVGNTDGDAHGVVARDRPAVAKDGRQVASADELHDDVLVAIGAVGPVVVHPDDVRMGEAAGRARLLLEAGRESRIGAVLRAEELDGDLAVELLVERTPDRGHAPLPEGRDQAVSAADEPTDHLHGASVSQVESADV
jgi:hypothetical protein